MTTVADTRLWHPFADMAQVRRDELTITSADGVWVWDDSGRRYLDAFASLWYVNVGHGRREIVDAVTAQMRELDAYTVFFDFANPAALDVAERLAELSGLDRARVLLGSGGGDGIEAAAKLARRYHAEMGEPARTTLLTRERAYHGTHGFGTSLAGIPENRSSWGEMIPDIARVPYDSLDALATTIDSIGAERIAAFFCEPVVGAGGVLAPPDGYIEGAAELCRHHGILFVCDAVISGFGRLGTWFGIERWGVVPDMIIFAKGVTSGYLPLGGVIVSGAIADPFWSTPGGPVLRHGPTWSGHPACCAAALANIDILEREGLIERGNEVERMLAEVIAPLAEREDVAAVRCGIGALAAIEVTSEADRARSPAMELAREMRSSGVIARALDSRTIAICPPLTVESEHVDLLEHALVEGLDRTAARATART